MMTEQFDNNQEESILPANKRLKRFMESISLLKALGFVCLVSLVIVFVSINLYLKSDRSKYDLYRPGQSKVEPDKTESNKTNIETSEDLPVYKDEIRQIEKEIEDLVNNQSETPSLKESDLSDQNLIPPDVDILQ